MRIDPKIAVVAVCLMFAQLASGQTNQGGTNLSHRKPALPSEITLNDGTTYKSVALKRVEPDGLFVTYIPDQGGVGMSKLKFCDLPEPIQKQFDFCPEKAAVHEQRQKDSNFHWARWQATEEEKASQVRREREKEDLLRRAREEAAERTAALQRQREKEATKTKLAQEAEAKRQKEAVTERDRWAWVRSENLQESLNQINRKLPW